MTYDVRELANHILDMADAMGRPITNVHVNKLVYFCHEEYLLTTGARLTNAKVEAWEYGPVFRELYSEFKQYGAGPISGRARRFDFGSKMLVDAVPRIQPIDAEVIDPLIAKLLILTGPQLIDLSHVPGGPWDLAFNHANRLNCGMEITDSLILEWGKSVRAN